MQGNIGTAYRQRTQVTMFFFLFMGVGLVERAKQKALRAGRHGDEARAAAMTSWRQEVPARRAWPWSRCSRTR